VGAACNHQACQQRVTAASDHEFVDFLLVLIETVLFHLSQYVFSSLFSYGVYTEAMVKVHNLLGMCQLGCIHLIQVVCIWLQTQTVGKLLLLSLLQLLLLSLGVSLIISLASYCTGSIGRGL
jgi:hypothetical protein